jgi:hypothetical protein
MAVPTRRFPGVHVDEPIAYLSCLRLGLITRLTGFAGRSVPYQCKK